MFKRRQNSHATSIIKEDNLERCYSRALFHLGRRALSSHKLKEKLSKYFTDQNVEQTIQQLVEKKYLDDQDYLQKKWDSGKRKGQSNYTLNQKMRLEGFDADSLKANTDLLQNDQEDLDTVLNYLKNKKRSLIADLSDNKSKEKIYRHLAYKGHRYSFIEKIWQKLTSEINH